MGTDPAADDLLDRVRQRADRDGARIARQPADGGRRRRRDPRRAGRRAASRSARSTSSRGAGSSTSATPTATAGRCRSSRTGRPAPAAPARTRMPEPRTYPEGVSSWVDVEVPTSTPRRRSTAGCSAGRSSGSRRTAPGYVIAQLDGQDVAGARPADDDPAWNTYIAVDDADAAAARVRAAGGRVARRTGRRRRRRAAPPAAPTRPACRSGSGRPARRPGAQLANAPGAWNFSDLHAADPARVRRRSTRRCSAGSSTTSASASMIRRPGYGDHLAATVDPGIHERQAGVSAPPGFADAIGWLAPRGPTRRRTGTCRSPSPTATRPPPTSSGSAAPCSRVATPTGPATRWSATRQGAVFTASQFTPPD